MHEYTELTQQNKSVIWIDKANPDDNSNTYYLHPPPFDDNSNTYDLHPPPFDDSSNTYYLHHPPFFLGGGGCSPTQGTERLVNKIL